MKFLLNYFCRRKIKAFPVSSSSFMFHYHHHHHHHDVSFAVCHILKHSIMTAHCLCLCDHGFGFLSLVVKASGTFYPLSAFSCGGAGTGSNPCSSSSSSSSTSSTSLGKVGGISRSSRGTSPSPPSPQPRYGAIITVPNNETSSEGRNRQQSGTGA